MTTRYVAYLVTLDREVRDDDAKPITDALLMVKGVKAVEPLADDGWISQKARIDRDTEWTNRLLFVMKQITS